MLLELEKERWTWDLIKNLYTDRVETVIRSEEEDMMVDDMVSRP